MELSPPPRAQNENFAKISCCGPGEPKNSIRIPHFILQKAIDCMKIISLRLTCGSGDNLHTIFNILYTIPPVVGYIELLNQRVTYGEAQYDASERTYKSALV